MKATTQHTLFCECNHALSYIASAAGPLTVLQCPNLRCQHYGKRFEAPTFELVEIPPQPAVVVEIGEGDVAPLGAQDLVADDAAMDPAP